MKMEEFTMSELYFEYGTVGCSKTANMLIEKYNFETKLGKKVLAIKPSQDTRDVKIRSRIGLESDCLHLDKDESVFKVVMSQKEMPNIVMVDEAQFLTKTQVEELYDLSLSIDVRCYGLLTDFRREYFEGSRELLRLADTFYERPSLCRCGRNANVNARFVDGHFTFVGDQIGIEDVGGKSGQTVTYEPMCKICYESEKRRHSRYVK